MEQGSGRDAAFVIMAVLNKNAPDLAIRGAGWGHCLDVPP
jgi:hypothetical protein